MGEKIKEVKTEKLYEMVELGETLWLNILKITDLYLFRLKLIL